MLRSRRVHSFFIVLICVTVFSACSGKGDDKNDGFKVTKTQATTETTPSATPKISQPCSLLSLPAAAEILNVAEAKLGKPESSSTDDGILRCRYAATSDDGELYLVLNVYVYEEQSIYDLVRKANKAQDVETTYDDGFTYDITKFNESERFVAAREGKNRVAISSSISTIAPKTELKPEQITLPDVNVLAVRVGRILFDL